MKIKCISFLTALTALFIVSLGCGSTVFANGPTAQHIRVPHIKVREGLAINWAGYAALTSLTRPQRNSVSDVSGNWVVPNLTCTSQNTYSASWLGIDGYASNTVEQIGTEHDCIAGNPRYYAWYEMYPKRSFLINLDIHTGDTVFAQVKYLGANKFNLILKDLTTGQDFSTTQQTRAKRESAEWISEAPSLGGVLPLANFGTENFSNAQATINGHTGSINDSLWKNDAITMIRPDGTPKAIPGPLSSDGTSFGIDWKNN